MHEDSLQHHGILGQKWGVRRFENKNGTLTAAGKARYKTDTNGEYKKIGKSGGSVASKVKKYNKAADEWSKKQDENNTEWENVKEMRKSLGKTGLGRTIAAARNKTDAAKAYNKAFEKWSEKQDKLDEDRRKVDALYKETGKNKIDRVLNNASNGNAKVKSDIVKKIAIAGGVTAAAGLTAYGGYKLYQLNKKATEGLSNEYHNAAVKKFVSANNLQSVAGMNKERLNAAADARDAGKILGAKAKSKDYSLKDKVDYLKSKTPTAVDKRIEKALTYNKDGSFTDYALNKQGIKTFQYNKVDYGAFSAAIIDGGKKISDMNLNGYTMADLSKLDLY